MEFGTVQLAMLVGQTQTLKPHPNGGAFFLWGWLDSKSPARGLADRALRGYEIRATTNAGGPPALRREFEGIRAARRH